jgi:hypothetical protein
MSIGTRPVGPATACAPRTNGRQIKRRHRLSQLRCGSDRGPENDSTIPEPQTHTHSCVISAQTSSRIEGAIQRGCQTRDAESAAPTPVTPPPMIDLPRMLGIRAEGVDEPRRTPDVGW